MVTNTISRLKENWQSALTVALISIPLSIALSIASGAGPLPGLIAGIWGTLIGSLFIGSEYNVIGAAGALTTVLFGATLAAPLGLGAAVLPLLALGSGAIIFVVWALSLDRYLYYIPSSVMYGFGAGVACLIAIAQLFDATGLSSIARTGDLIADIETFLVYRSDIHGYSFFTFAIFLVAILLWRRYVKRIPAVIPAAVMGVVVGFIEATYSSLDIISLQDKFGSFSATLWLPVSWEAIPLIVADVELISWLFTISGTIALIAVLETLITAKLADKLTHTESSSSRELFGLALSNLGSGVMGGLPTTGVFIRTGANIKAGATHRTSGVLAAVFTGIIALVALPFFSYMPMPVIAAILVNTALGLLEVDKFKEFWRSERQSFGIALLVATVTIFHDAGLAVGAGVVVALFLFAHRIAHGRFDVIWNYVDGTLEQTRGGRTLTLPVRDTPISVVTYSIAGNVGYIDAVRHLKNLKTLADSHRVPAVIVRLRNLFSLDFEGTEALAEGVGELLAKNTRVYVTSVSSDIEAELISFSVFAKIKAEGHFTAKTSEALAHCLAK